MKKTLAYLLVISGAVAFSPQLSVSAARSRGPGAQKLADRPRAPASQGKLALLSEQAGLVGHIQLLEATEGLGGQQVHSETWGSVGQFNYSLASIYRNPNAS